jgi:pimeloyl-ACP methyl ester carboxylesterase
MGLRRFALLMALVVWVNASAGEAFSCRTLAPHRDATITAETTLAGVPAIVRVPATVTKAPVVLWHGFGPPASEAALMDALPLDDVSAIKVYLGLPLFGKRADPDQGALQRRQAVDVALNVFEPIVMGAAKELPRVVAALRAGGCLGARERIGLFGFSAGGAAALYALAEHDVPIASAVVLNASTGLSASVAAYEHATGKTYTWTDRSRALASRADAAGRARDIASGDPPPALLIVQGANDATLTPELAISLHAALAPLYAGHDKDREQLMLLDGLSHNVTDVAGIDDLRRRIGDWFNRYLDRS